MATSCEPVDLLTAAKCFMCMDSRQLDFVGTYLACQAASGGIVGGTGILGEGGEFILGEGGEKILPE